MTSKAVYVSFAALQLARGLVLVAVVLSAWWVGGVTLSSKLTVAVLTAVALLALVISQVAGIAQTRASQKPTHQSRPPKLQLPTAALLIAVAWLAWAAFQLVPFPSSWAPYLAPGNQRLLTDFTQTVNGQGDDLLTAPVRYATLSLVPELTRSTLSWHVCIVGLFFVSVLAFRTASSRAYLLTTLAIHGTALAVWGIIQKTTGTDAILPNVENWVPGSSPFSSFFYKNSGGLAMNLSFAALLGLLLLRARSRTTVPNQSANPQRSSGNQGGPATIVLERTREGLHFFRQCLLDPLSLAIGLGLIVVLTALAFSLSRGAWLALTCGVILLMALLAFRAQTRMISLFVLVVLAIAAFSVTLGLEGQDPVAAQFDRLDSETFGEDGRWKHWENSVSAIWQTLPTGAGLGTYAYSTLPFQDLNYSGWFRQAHNQYLETLEESGLLGLLLVFVWIGILGRWAMHAMSDVDSQSTSMSERQVWGIVACLVLTVTALQSIVDFVITTPANTLTVAVLLGAFCAIERKSATPLPLAASLTRLAAPIRKKLTGLVSQPKTSTLKLGSSKLDSSKSGSLKSGSLKSGATKTGPAKSGAAKSGAAKSVPTKTGPAKSGATKSGALLTATIAWSIGTLVAVGFAILVFTGDLAIQRTLAATSLPPSNLAPTVESCVENIERLQAAPRSAQIDERSGDWQILLFRSKLFSKLVDEADRPRTEATWQSTSPVFLSNLIVNASPSDQPQTRRLLTGPLEMRVALDQAIRAWHAARRQNPFLLRVHLSLGSAATLVDRRPTADLIRANRLAGINLSLRFRTGAFAQLCGETEVMNATWRKLLTRRTRYLADITRLARRNQSDRETIETLYPPQPTLLLQAYDMPKLELSEADRTALLERCERLLTSERDSLDASESTLFRWQAKLRGLQSRWPEAADLYYQAAETDLKNASLRFELTNALMECQQYEAAEQQLNVGRILAPDSYRYKQLQSQLAAAKKSQKRMDE